MPVPVANCDVFIQAWVDISAFTAGEGGIYFVDTRAGHSSNEGTTNLQTAVASGDNVCWKLLPIDPNANVEDLEIGGITPSAVWGPDGPPQKVDATTYTGQVQHASGDTYEIDLNINGQTAKITTLSMTAT